VSLVNVSFTCHVGGICAPKPKAGNILSLHKRQNTLIKEATKHFDVQVPESLHTGM